MLYPFTFRPIFKERVWGGRKLEEIYHKPLPPGVPIGESWEISDRPGDVSVIANGTSAGQDLHWLVERHGADLLGEASPLQGRFPLLVKILDAREKLSLQVHPPQHIAAELRGEAKTEMWYIADAAPGAVLYVGLRRGVTREDFERKVRDGSVADCFHRIQVKAGDAMFLPSGRVHAIGGGLVIFEIQQNSDTTYRVFDWNRVGLDGKPRDVHVEQSLASIDFNDIEPDLVRAEFKEAALGERRTLVDHSLFHVEEWRLPAETGLSLMMHSMQILAVVAGTVKVGRARPVTLEAGQFCLIPAYVTQTLLRFLTEVTLLRIQGGKGSANAPVVTG